MRCFRHEGSGESFRARWKPSEERTPLDPEGRLTDEAAARAAMDAFGHDPQDGKITRYERKKKEEPPPLPFSLSALQVLAGKRYGYEPQQVLDTAQKLYEEKLTTYPRSDAEYLPVSQHKDAAKSLAISPRSRVRNLRHGRRERMRRRSRVRGTTRRSRRTMRSSRRPCP